MRNVNRVQLLLIVVLALFISHSVAAAQHNEVPLNSIAVAQLIIKLAKEKISLISNERTKYDLSEMDKFRGFHCLDKVEHVNIPNYSKSHAVMQTMESITKIRLVIENNRDLDHAGAENFHNQKLEEYSGVLSALLSDAYEYTIIWKLTLGDIKDSLSLCKDFAFISSFMKVGDRRIINLVTHILMHKLPEFAREQFLLIRNNEENKRFRHLKKCAKSVENSISVDIGNISSANHKELVSQLIELSNRQVPLLLNEHEKFDPYNELACFEREKLAESLYGLSHISNSGYMANFSKAAPVVNAMDAITKIRLIATNGTGINCVERAEYAKHNIGNMAMMLLMLSDVYEYTISNQLKEQNYKTVLSLCQDYVFLSSFVKSGNVRIVNLITQILLEMLPEDERKQLLLLRSSEEQKRWHWLKKIDLLSPIGK